MAHDRRIMTVRFLSLLALVACGFVAVSPAIAAGVSKSYSYFLVRGSTLEELEAELSKRGPEVNSTGKRHPGATQMEFTTKVSYARGDNYCRIENVSVVVKARIILPRWHSRGRADREARIVWNTLAADIKRHEESHVSIAKNHAREIEQSIMNLGRDRDCDQLAEKVAGVSARIMNKHDEAQARFDRVEGINFEDRMLRLLRYRIERIENGRLEE